MLGRKTIQIQHPSASKTCIIDVNPNVGGIHVNALPNKGAVDFEINSPSKLKVGQETTCSVQKEEEAKQCGRISNSKKALLKALEEFDNGTNREDVDGDGELE
jgi:hypothetical protein